jgi:hypothetical protein
MRLKSQYIISIACNQSIKEEIKKPQIQDDEQKKQKSLEGFMPK